MPLAIAPLLIIDAYIISSSTTQQNDIDQASLCVYLCSKYGVPAQKINKFCVDLLVCLQCVWLCFICVSFKITDIHIGFVCVYFEYTLLSNTWSTQHGFKSTHREHDNLLNTP